ncbi:MAG: hypothetical protein M3Q97_00825 [Bacteroidota bacterium]|nr:hypothetical protein [Bacteroidota bacterium]
MKKGVQLFLLFFLLSCGSALYGQQGAKGVYNNAVDRINCTTIKFVHTEAGRPETAEKMDCLSFEGILKSVPADEAGTTAKLAKDINAWKDKFTEGKDIGTQVDAVIAMVTKRIEAKPRKGSVPDFKKTLAEIRAEAVTNLAAAQEGDQPVSSDDVMAMTDEETADSADETYLAEEDNIVDERPEETDTADMGWLPWLALILSLAALGLSLFLMMRMKQQLAENDERINDIYNEMLKIKGPVVTESPGNYNLLEKNMHREMHNLRKYVDEKLAHGNTLSSSAPPQPVPASYREQESEIRASAPGTFGANVTSMMDQHDGGREEEVSSDFMDMNEDIPGPPPETQSNLTDEQIAEDITADTYPENELSEKSGTDWETTEDLSDQVSVVEAGAVKQASSRENNNASGYDETETSGAGAAAGYEDEEESWEPEFRYAGLPVDGQFFPKTALKESPGADSIFEIETYEEVPDKAFLSILHYSEIVARILAEPEKYLRDCCEYSNSPEGKTQITLLEEGILEKVEENWVIKQKARIKFS